MNKRTQFELRKQAKSSVKQLVMMMIIEWRKEKRMMYLFVQKENTYTYTQEDKRTREKKKEKD